MTTSPDDLLENASALWEKFGHGLGQLQAACAKQRLAKFWSRNGVNFLPLELERLGIKSDRVEDLSPIASRTDTLVEILDGRIVRLTDPARVRFRLYEKNCQYELGFKSSEASKALVAIKALATASSPAAYGVVLGSPRPPTTTTIREVYEHDGNGRVNLIRRALRQVDRGRALNSETLFHAMYDGEGVLTRIEGVSKQAISEGGLREIVYPKVGMHESLPTPPF